MHPRQRRQGLPGPHHRDSPLVDTNRIPSAATERWHEPSLNAAMKKCGDARGGRSGRPVRRTTWVLAGAAVLVAVTVTGGVVVASGADDATAAARRPPATTVQVERGSSRPMVSLDGTLTYRARSDGSPFSAINQARGTYTTAARATATRSTAATCSTGWTTSPVLLLCGTVPAYRDLDSRRQGNDVRQLNRNLHVSLRRRDRETRLEKRLQRDKGFAATGALDLGDAVFLPEPVRIAKVTGELGGSARPGAPVAQATSDTLEVQVNLEASQQGEVKRGRPCADHAARQHVGDGEGGPARESRPDRRARTTTPQPRPSRPTSVSTSPRRRAGSTGPRSRWTSRPREWRAP